MASHEGLESGMVQVAAAAPLRGLQSRALATWTSPVGAALASILCYAAIALVFNPSGLGQSAFPYYVFQADAFLHGHLALIHPLAETKDLSLVHGQYYLYWPPLPAILLLPLVAIFGAGFSDTVPTILVGGINVALVSLLLSALAFRGIARLSPEKRAWITAFFALGTVHVTLAPYGRVWFTAQLLAFALMCGAYLVPLKFSGRTACLLSGSMAAGSFLCRNSILVVAIWPLWYLWMERDRSERFSALRVAGVWLAPIGLALLIQGIFNYLRFGSILDSGFLYQQWDAISRANYERYGAFSLHHLPVNLFYYFVAFPYATLFGENSSTQFFMGGSLFLMSPVFLLAFSGVARRWGQHGWVLAASCLAGLVPLLLLQGTGWMQFGPRYTLDITVPLLVAVSVESERAPLGLLSRLGIVSMGIYIPGAFLLGMAI